MLLGLAAPAPQGLRDRHGHVMGEGNQDGAEDQPEETGGCRRDQPFHRTAEAWDRMARRGGDIVDGVGGPVIRYQQELLWGSKVIENPYL